ncbi:MAG TPA: DUF1653 domain-containing protein [Thermoanaerobaculia bacterium]|nr:DUF1653 domain-containing protein [Thermoanaerobaculia bacterium]
MTVSRGWYRHYKGHAYVVLGVACLKHEGDRRVVIYTSVKTEEGSEGFDFLARDEKDFEVWVDPENGQPFVGTQSESCFRRSGCVRRFERITDPEKSIVPA